MESYSCRPLAKYVPDENELLESEDLEVIGEDPGNGSLSTGTIPVRTLTEFSVFNAETGHLVSLGSLLVPRDSQHLSSFCAVGYVLPATENAIDDPEEILESELEDCQYIRLSSIRSISLFNLDDDCEVLDRYSIGVVRGGQALMVVTFRRIWLETKHAWYIVGTPSPAYAKTFREFGLAHELTYTLLSSCLQDHQVTVSTFKERIQKEYPPDIVQNFENSLRNGVDVGSQFVVDW